MLLKILIHPNEILRKKSVKIKNFSDPIIQSLAKELLEIMKKENGLGLAAPQLGYNLRMIVINTKESDQIFINPKIYWKSFFKNEILEEGCLSVPNVFGLVKRAKKVWVKYYNLDGQKIKIKAEGLLARVFQHEIDHLNGVLFIDKAKEIIKGKEILEKRF